MLLGTLIVFTSLSQHSEVVSMKASGLSAHQILAPLILASLVIAGAAFAFNETVAVKSARTVNAWTDNDYEPIRATSDLSSNVWLTVDGDFVRARLVAGRGANLTLRNVRIFEREWPDARNAWSMSSARCRTEHAGDWRMSAPTTPA